MNDKNTLTRFLAGLALMIVGLFILFNRVHVGPAGWGGWGRFTIGRFSFPSGLVMIPFIIGIIWMFGSGGNLISKIFTAFSVLLILAAIIMNSTFWLDRMTMFDWILILVMIFGGGGIVASVLFAEKKEEKKEQQGDQQMVRSAGGEQQAADVDSKRIQSIEEELQALKRTIDNNNNNTNV